MSGFREMRRKTPTTFEEESIAEADPPNLRHLHQQHIGEGAAGNRHEERLAPEMNQDGDDDGQSHAPVETMLPL